VRVAIDVAGLDGLWWRAERPVRREVPEHPTLFALTGALRLGAPLERTDFLVKPGPGAPYVIPRLLEEARAVAVVSTVEIGTHTGYVVAYFAPADATRRPTNEWGTDTYRVRTPRGLGWGTVDQETRDFALRPWIERKRLRWIAPGDATLTPREGEPDCPYLDIAGPREPQRIQYGRAW